MQSCRVTSTLQRGVGRVGVPTGQGPVSRPGQGKKRTVLKT